MFRRPIALAALLLLCILAAASLFAAQTVGAAPARSRLAPAAVQLFQVGTLAAQGLPPEVGPVYDVATTIALNDARPLRTGILAALPFSATVTSARTMIRSEAGNDAGAGAQLDLSICDYSLTPLRTLGPLTPVLTDESLDLQWLQTNLPAPGPGGHLGPDELLCWVATRQGPGNYGLTFVVQATAEFLVEAQGTLYLPTVQNKTAGPP